MLTGMPSTVMARSVPWSRLKPRRKYWLALPSPQCWVTIRPGTASSTSPTREVGTALISAPVTVNWLAASGGGAEAAGCGVAPTPVRSAPIGPAASWPSGPVPVAPGAAVAADAPGAGGRSHLLRPGEAAASEAMPVVAGRWPVRAPRPWRFVRAPEPIARHPRPRRVRPWPLAIAAHARATAFVPTDATRRAQAPSGDRSRAFYWRTGRGVQA